jgi:hypothetical protein
MSGFQVFSTSGGGGSGNVTGPASSTDNALVRWDGTTGQLIQNSLAILSDAGSLTGLTALSVNGLSTLGAGQVVKVTSPGAYPYTVLTTDYLIIVDTSLARTINLNVAPTAGQTYRIKDNTGTAGTNNITVTPAAGTIDGAGTASIASNYGAIDVIFTGSQWVIL